MIDHPQAHDWRVVLDLMGRRAHAVVYCVASDAETARDLAARAAERAWSVIIGGRVGLVEIKSATRLQPDRWRAEDLLAHPEPCLRLIELSARHGQRFSVAP